MPPDPHCLSQHHGGFWLLCPWEGDTVCPSMGTGAGQEWLGNRCSPPGLVLAEQTLAALPLAGAAAYFWKFLRLSRRDLRFLSFHSQTGSF